VNVNMHGMSLGVGQGDKLRVIIDTENKLRDARVANLKILNFLC